MNVAQNQIQQIYHVIHLKTWDNRSLLGTAGVLVKYTEKNNQLQSHTGNLVFSSLLLTG